MLRAAAAWVVLAVAAAVVDGDEGFDGVVEAFVAATHPGGDCVAEASVVGTANTAGEHAVGSTCRTGGEYFALKTPLTSLDSWSPTAKCRTCSPRGCTKLE